MHRYVCFTLSFVLAAVFATPLSAQERRFSAALKGGATIERSEDALEGTAPALGITGAAALTPWWRAEVEFWLPGYLEDEHGEPEHRDILLSFSAVRHFRAGAARPYLLAGLSFARTQDWFTFCTAQRPPATGGNPVPAIVSCDAPDVIERRRERNEGRDGYALIGTGIEVPLGRRVSLIADLRLSLAPVSVLVRPSLGLSTGF